MIRQPMDSILPAGFAKDFKPELRLLAQLLCFAKKNGMGNKEDISEATGIPTGSQTGKVEPMIYFAVGMGLINALKKGLNWQLSLTPLGAVIVVEDPYLTEPVSLWMMHLMLCRRRAGTIEDLGIADPWYALFALGESRLGKNFSSEEFWQFLKERYGDSSYLKGMAVLILRSYEEDSCLGLTKALYRAKKTESPYFSRTQAPQHKEFYPVYTSFLFLIWDEFFPNSNQLSLEELFRSTRMLNVLNWKLSEAQNWLNWLADNGALQLDRQTGDILALRTSTTLTVLSDLYNELI